MANTAKKTATKKPAANAGDAKTGAAPEKDSKRYNDAASEILDRIGKGDIPSDVKEQLEWMDNFEVEYPGEDKGFAKKIRQKLAGKA